MYNYREVTEDLYWVGANDRRLSVFEGIYQVPRGVSYNAYLLLDEKTVLLDTVDLSVSAQFFENLSAALQGRALDYLVIHHMEPDHSATVEELVRRYPKVQLVCNAKTSAMLRAYFSEDLSGRTREVKEGDVLETGRHKLHFVMAPMVHWPEVMVSWDETDKILFSADAFGCFGALDGTLFADEVDFDRDHLDEARRYYTNIVGQYGKQVCDLLKKADGLEIKMLCPLHGFVWRQDLGYLLDKYARWASYTPEETGVVIAYGSVYGHTANAAEILAFQLRERGMKVKLFDVSVTSSDHIVAACFQYSHLVFASTTYNGGIFLKMDELLHDLASHNIQNRTVALLQNGSWAPTCGKLMAKRLEHCKNLTILDKILTIKAALEENQLADLDALANALAN